MTGDIPWIVCVITLVMLHYVGGRQERGLSDLHSIALDRDTSLEKPIIIRSVYGYFSNMNGLWVQLWHYKNNTNSTFVLDWQFKVIPTMGNGSLDVINLPPDQYIEVMPHHRMGIINHVVPGPIEGQYEHGAGMVLSLRSWSESEEVYLTLETELDFDDLLLPYRIPVYMCNQTDCPEAYSGQVTPEKSVWETSTVNKQPVRPINTAKPRPIGLSTSPDYLSEEFIFGLLIWNILLTAAVMVIMCILVCMCADFHRRSKHKLVLTPSKLPGYFPREWYEQIYSTLKEDSTMSSGDSLHL